jgi:N-glycosylase/DNA lyase
MLVESYDNIVELINLSNFLHKKEIESFKKYFYKKKTNAEKWFELIYSILVGTQIKTEKVLLCYNELLKEYMDLLHPDFLIKLEDYNYLKELIENSLKKNGYRFYNTKSNTIHNTILFFKEYEFNIDDFLKIFQTFDKIRWRLMEIPGIGFKIASHWLRNIGFYIPVIDIHIKNIFYRFKLVDENNIDYDTYEKIQNQIIEKIKIDNISFDLAIWYYGKNYCGNRKCKKCKLSSICRR